MSEEVAGGTEAKGSNGSTPLTAVARTHRGLVRRTNEDAYLVAPPLFAVADGLGGLAAGEVAAGLAIEVLAGAQPGQTAMPDLAELLRRASARIRAAAQADSRLAGMGTTCTVIFVGPRAVDVAHVGDTRAYALRGSDMTLLTRDHSLAQELVRVGRLSEGEAVGHISRNTLTRALGAPGALDVDRAEWPYRDGDRMLLCSDGLTGMVDDGRICALLAGGTPEDAAAALVDAALAAGGSDNVTVVVVDIGVSQSAA